MRKERKKEEWKTERIKWKIKKKKQKNKGRYYFRLVSETEYVSIFSSVTHNNL